MYFYFFKIRKYERDFARVIELGIYISLKVVFL